MEITIDCSNNRWRAEVWNGEEATYDIGGVTYTPSTHTEEVYQNLNQWCLETLGYRARTAFNLFEFKQESELQWFLLRWT
jgi:hypothetical protein